MKKNVQFFAKSTLTLSLLVLTSMTHAELSLQQQVDQLQQQVQALQELVQQQQKVYDQKLNEQKRTFRYSKDNFSTTLVK